MAVTFGLFCALIIPHRKIFSSLSWRLQGSCSQKQGEGNELKMQRSAVGVVPCPSTQPHSHLCLLFLVQNSFPSPEKSKEWERRKKDQLLGLVEVARGGQWGGGAFLADEQQVTAQSYPPLS